MERWPSSINGTYRFKNLNSTLAELSVVGFLFLLNSGFDFGQARVASVGFAMCHFDVRFRHFFAIILRWFLDRFDISLEKKKHKTTSICHRQGPKVCKKRQSPIHIFIWFGDHRIQDAHLRFIFLGGFDFYKGFSDISYVQNLHHIDINRCKNPHWHLQPWPSQNQNRQAANTHEK